MAAGVKPLTLPPPPQEEVEKLLSLVLPPKPSYADALLSAPSVQAANRLVHKSATTFVGAMQINLNQTSPSSTESTLSHIGNGLLRLQPATFHQGKPSVLFKKSEKVKLIKDFRHVLVAKFSHGRPALKSIHLFFKSLNLKGLLQLSVFDSKHVIIVCGNFEDFALLWIKRSWNICGFIVRLFKWDEHFNPAFESSISPVWLHLRGLPLYLFDELALLRIANVFGSPLHIDKDNISKRKLGYASICVEMDVSLAPVDKIWIGFEGEDGSENSEGFWQQVVFDHIPYHCSYCKHLGHSASTCKRMLEAGFLQKSTSSTSQSAEASLIKVDDGSGDNVTQQVSKSGMGTTSQQSKVDSANSHPTKNMVLASQESGLMFGSLVDTAGHQVQAQGTAADAVYMGDLGDANARTDTLKASHVEPHGTAANSLIAAAAAHQENCGAEAVSIGEHVKAAAVEADHLLSRLVQQVPEITPTVQGVQDAQEDGNVKGNFQLKGMLANKFIGAVTNEVDNSQLFETLLQNNTIVSGQFLMMPLAGSSTAAGEHKHHVGETVVVAAPAVGEKEKTFSAAGVSSASVGTAAAAAESVVESHPRVAVESPREPATPAMDVDSKVDDMSCRSATKSAVEPAPAAKSQGTAAESDQATDEAESSCATAMMVLEVLNDGVAGNVVTTTNSAKKKGGADYDAARVVLMQAATGVSVSENGSAGIAVISYAAGDLSTGKGFNGVEAGIQEFADAKVAAVTSGNAAAVGTDAAGNVIDGLEVDNKELQVHSFAGIALVGQIVDDRELQENAIAEQVSITHQFEERNTKSPSSAAETGKDGAEKTVLEAATGGKMGVLNKNCRNSHNSSITPRKLSSAAAEFTPKWDVLVEELVQEQAPQIPRIVPKEKAVLVGKKGQEQRAGMVPNYAMDRLNERMRRLRGEPAVPILDTSTWVAPSMSKHLARELKKNRKQYRSNQNWQDIEDYSDEESEEGELDERAGSQMLNGKKILTDGMGDIHRPFKIKSAPNSPNGKNSSYDSSTYLLSRSFF